MKQLKASPYTLVTLAALVVMILTIPPRPALASVINGTLNFTLTTGSPAPLTGSFTYNTTTQAYTAFTVNWDDLTFSFLSTQIPSPSQLGPGFYQAGAQSSPVAFAKFALEAPTETASGTLVTSGPIVPATSDGAYTVTVQTPVPEPTTLLLVGLGLIFIAGLRRKFTGQIHIG